VGPVDGHAVGGYRERVKARAWAVRLAVAGVLGGCSARVVEDEEEDRSHRHLAAEYCEQWCTFWYGCEPVFEGRPVSVCQESCESDEAWDWTDECGDLKWEFLECRLSLECEEARDDPEVPGTDDPCQPHVDELLIAGCTF
jgi:hypothetical protein